MARRNADEILAEFHRLSDIFDLFNEFVAIQKGPVAGAEYLSSILTREQSLYAVARKETTLSQITSGTRQAVNDQNVVLADIAEEGDPFATDFFEFYKTRTGRNYYDDAGCIKKMARAIFRRGEIADETEYYLLKEFLIDTMQSVFKPKELKALSLMMASYEDSVAKG